MKSLPESGAGIRGSECAGYRRSEGRNWTNPACRTNSRHCPNAIRPRKGGNLLRATANEPGRRMPQLAGRGRVASSVQFMV